MSKGCPPNLPCNSPCFWEMYYPRLQPPAFRPPMNYPICNPSYYRYPNIPFPHYYAPQTQPLAVPYDPTKGKYGSCDITINGNTSSNDCQYGYFPQDVPPSEQGSCVCCNAFGECGSGDKPMPAY